jgi:hypothetical protein
MHMPDAAHSAATVEWVVLAEALAGVAADNLVLKEQAAPPALSIWLLQLLFPQRFGSILLELRGLSCLKTLTVSLSSCSRVIGVVNGEL